MGIKSFIRNKLYPSFDCEDCIGMKQYGCQCDYYEAIAPGVGPTKFLVFLRKIWKNIDKPTNFNEENK